MTVLIILKLALAAFVLWGLIVSLLIVHEWGHLLVMKRLGIKPDRVVIGNVRLFTVKLFHLDYEIGLIPMWGYVASEQYQHSASAPRALVAAGGPVMSLLTGIAFWVANTLHKFWLIALLAKGSFLLVLTNLIPFPPLDGWTMIEHFVLKAGITITPRGRQILLCAGFVVISIFVILR